jgi:hypothetical protein
MGVHVDHGFLLGLSSTGLTPKVTIGASLFANSRAIYFNRHSEARRLEPLELLKRLERLQFYIEP